MASLPLGPEQHHHHNPPPDHHYHHYHHNNVLDQAHPPPPPPNAVSLSAAAAAAAADMDTDKEMAGPMVEGNDPLTGHIISTTIGGKNGEPKRVKGEANISYICSHYYRAPELIFGATEYTSSIDIWSAGCVLAELLLGQALFPGENAVDQLVEIIKVLGTPTREEIRCMNPNYTDFRFPQIKAHPWHKVFHKRMPQEVIDLASRLLQYSPNLRCRAMNGCSPELINKLIPEHIRRQTGT